MQSEPASLAPEVNPLLFHAFLPANVILHFPAGSRDVVGHLSAQCTEVKKGEINYSEILLFQPSLGYF